LEFATEAEVVAVDVEPPAEVEDDAVEPAGVGVGAGKKRRYRSTSTKKEIKRRRTAPREVLGRAFSVPKEEDDVIEINEEDDDEDDEARGEEMEGDELVELEEEV